MKKVAIGGALVGLAFIIAVAFWLAYRNSAENDIAVDETPVQSPVVQSGQEAPTAKQGAQDSPTETAEGEAEAAANGDAPPLVTKPRVAYTNEKGEMIGITRQGNEYIINPHQYGPVPSIHDPTAWAAAAEEPTGPPLSLPWWKAEKSDPIKKFVPGADFTDPRAWESYRNFFGFDPPFNPNGSSRYRAMIDNWGKPIQWHDNTAIVIDYGRRTGFRPSPEQLERYMNLEDEWRRARFVGDSDAAEALRQKMRNLRDSAQGMLPNTETVAIIYQGTGNVERTRESRRRTSDAAIRDLYKRMDIEHLYEFYEKPDFRKNRK